MNRFVTLLPLVAIIVAAGCNETEITRTDTVESSAPDNDAETDPATGDTSGETDENLAIIEQGIRDSIEGRDMEIVDIEMQANEDRTVYTGYLDAIDRNTGESVRADCTVAADDAGVPQLQCTDPRPEYSR